MNSKQRRSELGQPLLDRRAWAIRATLAATSVLPGSQVRAQSQDAAAPALPKAVDWPVVPLLDGDVIEPADWVGQVSVLEFWATWCPFCKRQNAHLDKLHRSLREQGLRVLAVSVDGDADKVGRYMQGNGYDFPVALDSASGLRARITTRRVIPLTCVIDRQGRLAQLVPGEMFEEDLFDLARHALSMPA